MICQIFTVVSLNTPEHNKYQEHFRKHQNKNISLTSKEPLSCCQSLSQGSRQRSRTEGAQPLTLICLQVLECSGHHGEILIITKQMVKWLSFCSVFKKLLLPNVFISTQAPGGLHLEWSHCGHRIALQVRENILETLLGTENTWHIFVFLKSEGQRTTTLGFWNLDDMSSSSLHLRPNPLTSGHSNTPLQMWLTLPFFYIFSHHLP